MFGNVVRFGRFIEFMPFTGNKWDDAKLVPYRTALRAAAAEHALEPAPPRPNDTATVRTPNAHAPTHTDTNTHSHARTHKTHPQTHPPSVI